MKNIETKVLQVIRSNIDRKDVDISLNTSLTKDLNVDSFDKIMIIAGLEEEFNINIDVEDFTNFDKIEQIVDRLKEELT